MYTHIHVQKTNKQKCLMVKKCLDISSLSNVKHFPNLLIQQSYFLENICKELFHVFYFEQHSFKHSLGCTQRRINLLRSEVAKTHYFLNPSQSGYCFKKIIISKIIVNNNISICVFCVPGMILNGFHMISYCFLTTT